MEYFVIPVTNFKQNCSLVWCKHTCEGIIIDPGGNADILYQVIFKLKINITKILLTHAHIDHIGAAMETSTYYKVPIYGPHKADQLLFDNLIEQCKILNEISIPSFLPNKWLTNDDQINFGQETLLVRHCPGHSPGHVIYYNIRSKFIFMGDVLFNGSIGRTDLPGGDSKILMQSINNELLSLSNDVVFLPGHGPISTIGHERYTNPFLIKKSI